MDPGSGVDSEFWLRTLLQSLSNNPGRVTKPLSHYSPPHEPPQWPLFSGEGGRFTTACVQSSFSICTIPTVIAVQRFGAQLVQLCSTWGLAVVPSVVCHLPTPGLPVLLLQPEDHWAQVPPQSCGRQLQVQAARRARQPHSVGRTPNFRLTPGVGLGSRSAGGDPNTGSTSGVPNKPAGPQCEKQRCLL